MNTLMKFFRLGAIFSGLLIGTLTVAWLVTEANLSSWAPATPEVAFTHGTIGVELLPLKYALVLEDVSGQRFREGRDKSVSIWRAFGFLKNPREALNPGPACLDNAGDKLPFGFNISYRVPLRGFVTPVPFAGLSCAACHSSNLHLSNGRKIGPILGAGNQELDLTAWTDRLRSAILDPDLTASKILMAYQQRCGKPKGIYRKTMGQVLEKAVLSLWLSGARSSVIGDFSGNDLPYTRPNETTALYLPAGPGRTRAFRGMVNLALSISGNENRAFSKIPVTFEQSSEFRPFSQYDGGIGDPVARSVIAAFAAGASIESLSKPEVVNNIVSAARFTEHLGTKSILSYSQMFPELTPTREAIDRGRLVYETYCLECHGSRPIENHPWSVLGASKINQILPAKSDLETSAIGTDPERATFRYGPMLPLGAWTSFPGAGDNLAAQKRALDDAIKKARRQGDFSRAAVWQNKAVKLSNSVIKYPNGHPLYFTRKTVRFTGGYVNSPIPRAFLRFPYLHNASIPNMRQLINLDPRPSVFCRGALIYDPLAMGTETVKPGKNGHCPPRAPFLFDTRTRGNSNAGHNYPWKFEDPARNPAALRDLMEYLKTL